MQVRYLKAISHGLASTILGLSITCSAAWLWLNIQLAHGFDAPVLLPSLISSTQQLHLEASRHTSGESVEFVPFGAATLDANDDNTAGGQHGEQDGSTGGTTLDVQVDNHSVPPPDKPGRSIDIYPTSSNADDVSTQGVHGEQKAVIDEHAASDTQDSMSALPHVDFAFHDDTPSDSTSSNNDSLSSIDALHDTQSNGTPSLESEVDAEAEQREENAEHSTHKGVKHASKKSSEAEQDTVHHTQYDVEHDAGHHTMHHTERSQKAPLPQPASSLASPPVPPSPASQQQSAHLGLPNIGSGKKAAASTAPTKPAAQKTQATTANPTPATSAATPKPSGHTNKMGKRRPSHESASSAKTEIAKQAAPRSAGNPGKTAVADKQHTKPNSPTKPSTTQQLPTATQHAARTPPTATSSQAAPSLSGSKTQPATSGAPVKVKKTDKAAQTTKVKKPEKADKTPHIQPHSQRKSETKQPAAENVPPNKQEPEDASQLAESNLAESIDENYDVQTLVGLSHRRVYDYRNVVLPPKVNRRSYGANNAHLKPRLTTEDYVELMFQAIRSDDVAAIKTLLKSGNNIDATHVRYKGYTPLMYAIKMRKTKAARYLIVKKAALNKRSSDGKTALHAAATTQNVDILLELLTAGADIAITDVTCRRATTYLSHTPSPEVAIKISSYYKDKAAALHDFTTLNSVSAVKHLLNKGVEVNTTSSQCPSEELPLMIAIANNNAKMLSLLLNKGADPNKRNRRGQTALEMADAFGQQHMVDMVRTEAIKRDLERAATVGETSVYREEKLR